MRYFELHPHRLDDATLAAWDAELAKLSAHLSGARISDCCGSDVFAGFVVRYRELAALPRRARRIVRRELAGSRQVRVFLRRRFACSVSADVQRQLAGSIAGAALVLALCQNFADAATINVTTNVPIIAVDGRCSLVEAIINANDDAATHPDCTAGSGSDTIVLPGNSTHSVKTALGSYYGASALPLITSAITIEGNGGRISRPKSKILFRLVTVTNSGDLTLRNVTLSGGRETYGGAVFNAGNLAITSATISGGYAPNGGAIFNAPTGNLAISDSMVSKNTGYLGGALFNYNGNTNIQNSTISHNKGGTAGAVLFFGGSLEVNNSEISGNRASLGGAFWIGYGEAAIENSSISQNRASAGGGLYIRSGALAIQDTVIEKNTAEDGAGMWIASGTGSPTVTIQNSVISANKSSFFAGGILLQSSGGTLTIENSAIVENRARFSGGGIDFNFGTLIIENSTVSGNKAGTEGGGIHSSNTLVLTNSTISGNSAKKGGGLYQGSGQVTMSRSLITGNKANTGNEIQLQTAYGATAVVNDFNIFGSSGNAGVVGFTPGGTDLVPSVAVSAILGPLAENGGPTPTHALVAGSPAIDAVPGAHPECSGTDQRGVARPQGSGCDIGAFEK